MRRLMTMTAGLILTLALAVAANAAPAGKGTAPKTGKGIQNAKKVAQAKMDRSKKMQDLEKKGHAKRQQAMKR
ncbi:hypothetical protein M1B72_20920 [Geomonas paludis]|uniref:Uncharacterized protein n=1 Tax=Geomonas paludis TaxID=2740185 RepID=A0A6V8MSB1_9BACT|nr:hypothetical protein [Geomonas paludis]UPU35873.1 hypothetical protein M1B72_20920 [Geomonas paludis]GFO62543.1 hypothetical protein GMPD_04620 [Geomonas paludis]